MGFRLFLILLLTAVIAYNGGPAEPYSIGSALIRGHVSWMKTDAAASSPAGEETSKERHGDLWKCKGVLVRRFRLRSRLNTHLLKLRFL